MASDPMGIEKLVCDDIAVRQQLGIVKYGVTVAENPLELIEWLQHQYEELLDAAIYCRAAIEKLKNNDTLQN
jgi:hypothetical protein